MTATVMSPTLMTATKMTGHDIYISLYINTLSKYYLLSLIIHVANIFVIKVVNILNVYVVNIITYKLYVQCAYLYHIFDSLVNIIVFM